MNKKLKIIVLVLMAGVIALGTIYFFFPQALLQFFISQERSSANLKESFLLVKESEQQSWNFPYLETNGSPKGKEVILMVHGFGGDKDNWTRFTAHLPDRYHAIIPDLPGFGENERKPEARYDVRSQVIRLHAFMSILRRELGFDKYHIVGNSMGGHIAGIYAVTYPEEVLSVGLVDNAGVSATHKSEHEKLIEKGVNKLIAHNEKEFETLLNFVFFEMPTIPGPILKLLSERAIASNEFNAKIFDEYKNKFPYPLEPRLKDIQSPVWILWGDKDRIIDVSTVDVMRSKLKNARVDIMKNCGHIPMAERPEEAAAKYTLFLESIPSK